MQFVTNPSHGGKVTCHECGTFIEEGQEMGYRDHQHKDEFPKYHFHKQCYNPWAHYYGIDKAID